MTDPLGQSQVLPYLTGLSAAGHSITLLSLEKPSRLAAHKSTIEKITSENNINWKYLEYQTHKIGLVANYINQKNIKNLAYGFPQKFDIIHCRSYISAIIGNKLKERDGSKFIFDMRGFWADERVDGKVWNLSNPPYYFLYNYFKRLEKKFLYTSDSVVTLTNKAKEIISDWGYQSEKITVIPCCADLDFFTPKSIKPELQQKLKQKFGISETTTVMSYLGSVGTWYMLGEMLDCFKELLQTKPDSVFLFITQDKAEEIKAQAIAKGIPAEKIAVEGAARADVPTYLSLSTFSIFFILPAFSKQASSPTKLAETVSMGVPVLCNSGVGDVQKHVTEGNFGEVIEQFNTEAYRKALTSILTKKPYKINTDTLNEYSVVEGIKKYATIYRNCLEK